MKDDLSEYIHEDDEYWMTASQAASYISAKSSHTISVSYLNQLMRHGRLEARKVGGRFNLYPYSQVSQIVVERKPGPKRDRRLPNPSPGALRQRKFRARRKQTQEVDRSPSGSEK